MIHHSLSAPLRRARPCARSLPLAAILLPAILLLASGPMCQNYYLRPGAGPDLARLDNWEASSGEAPRQLASDTRLHVLLPASIRLQIASDLAIGLLRLDNGDRISLEGSGAAHLHAPLEIVSGEVAFESVPITGSIAIGKALTAARVQVIFENCDLRCRFAATGSRRQELSSFHAHPGAALVLRGGTADLEVAYLQACRLENSRLGFDKLIVSGSISATGSSLKGHDEFARLELRLDDGESGLDDCEVAVGELTVQLGPREHPATLLWHAGSAFSRAATGRATTLRVVGNPASHLRFTCDAARALAKHAADLEVDRALLSLGAPGSRGFTLDSAVVVARGRVFLVHGSTRIVQAHRPARIVAAGGLLIGKADVQLEGGQIESRTIRILDDADEIRRAIGDAFPLDDHEDWDRAAGALFAAPGQSPGAGSEAPEFQFTPEERTRLQEALGPIVGRDLDRVARRMRDAASGPGAGRLREWAAGTTKDPAELAAILRGLLGGTSNAPIAAGDRSDPDPAEGAKVREILRPHLPGAAGGGGIEPAPEPLYTTVVRGRGRLVGDVELHGQLRPEDTQNHLLSAHALAIDGDLRVGHTGGVLLPISANTRIAFGSWTGPSEFITDHLGGSLADRLAHAYLTLKGMLADLKGLGACYASVRYYKRSLAALATKLAFWVNVLAVTYDGFQYATHGGAHFPVHVTGRLDFGGEQTAAGALRPDIDRAFVAELAAGQMYRGCRTDSARTGRRARFPAVIEDCVRAQPPTPQPAPVPDGLGKGDRSDPPRRPRDPSFQPVPPGPPAVRYSTPGPVDDALFLFEDYAHKQVNVGVGRLPLRLWLDGDRVHAEPWSREGIAANPLRQHVTLVVHGADSACDVDAVCAALREIDAATTWPLADGESMEINRLAGVLLHAGAAGRVASQCELWLVDWREFATGADDTHGWTSAASLFSHIVEVALASRVDAYIKRIPGLGNGWTKARRYLADEVLGRSAQPLTDLGSTVLDKLGLDVETFHIGLFLEASRIALQIGHGLGHWLRESGVDLSNVQSIDMHAEGAGLWLAVGMTDVLDHSSRWRAASHVVAYNPPLGFRLELVKRGLGSFVEGLTLGGDGLVPGRGRDILLLGDTRASVYTGLAVDGAWASYAAPGDRGVGVPAPSPNVRAFDVAWSDPQMHFAVRESLLEPLIASSGDALPRALRNPDSLEEAVFGAMGGVTLGSPAQPPPVPGPVPEPASQPRTTREEPLQAPSSTRATEGTPSGRTSTYAVDARQLLAVAHRHGVVDRMHPSALFHGAAVVPVLLWPRGAVWPMEFYARTVLAALHAKPGTNPQPPSWSLWHEVRDEAQCGFHASGLARLAGVGVTAPSGAPSTLRDLPLGKE